jgi:hypothetical protein
MQRLLQLATLMPTLALDGYVRFGSIADAPSLARAGWKLSNAKTRRENHL